MIVEPNPRLTVDCACGECGLHGTPKRRPLGHVRGCPCVRCRNKNNRARGDAKARLGRKALRLPGVNSRHEEVLGGPVRVEFKSGKKANPVLTAYRNAKAQSEAARPIGDSRPFCAGFIPEGSSTVLFVVSSDDLDAFVVGLAQAWEASCSESSSESR